MKVTFKFNRRLNVYVTLFACFAGLVMMVNRFGLSVSQLLNFTIIAVGLLLCIILVAAIAGYLLRLFKRD